jgi:hypothetical protein
MSAAEVIDSGFCNGVHFSGRDKNVCQTPSDLVMLQNDTNNSPEIEAVSYSVGVEHLLCSCYFSEILFFSKFDTIVLI